jgi:hypothetical protein
LHLIAECFAQAEYTTGLQMNLLDEVSIDPLVFISAAIQYQSIMDNLGRVAHYRVIKAFQEGTATKNGVFDCQRLDT